MSDRSLKASKSGIQIAKNALTTKKLTQENLANDLDIARSTVSNFFRGKAVDRQIFVSICEALGELNWLEIAEVEHHDPSNTNTHLGSSEQTTGTNPVNSSGNQNGDQIYIERPAIEQDCYKAIKSDLALIRIKAPSGMGKTMLLNKLLSYAKGEKGYTSIIRISFDREVLKTNDYTLFIQWLCKCLSDGLNFRDVSWNSSLGSDRNVTKHIESILNNIGSNSKLIITMRNFEVLFEFSNIFRDFCSLIRDWFDNDDDIRRKLCIIIVYSTEPYVRYDINKSPFNIGTTIELPGFTKEQVGALVSFLNLNKLLKDFLNELEQLRELVNGHPRLIINALNYIKNGRDIRYILKKAPTEEGIFGSHLREQLSNLRERECLLRDYRTVVLNYKNNKTCTRLDSNSIFQLYGLGLVIYHNNECFPSCPLYCEYFYDILIINTEGEND